MFELVMKPRSALPILMLSLLIIVTAPWFAPTFPQASILSATFSNHWQTFWLKNRQVGFPVELRKFALGSGQRPRTTNNEFYVSPEGSDDNPGTLEQPFKTINKAASKVNAGDIVYVRGGVYVEKAHLYQSGTDSAPIRFMAYAGEIPVIDGQGTLGPNWGVLLDLTGDYIEVSGFEVKNSAGMCVRLAGKHDKASNIKAHHCEQNGILITGDFSIVEDSEVWWSASSRAGNTWASGLSAARHPHGAVIRGNYVHDNWGEGISTFEATGTIIEDNIVRDSWSANLYVSDATHVLVQNNEVFTTEESEIQTGTRVGIMLGDEKCLPCSSDITVINNHVYNTERNFYWWQGASDRMVNTTISENVFEESTNVAGVQINEGDHIHTLFENNTIVQTNGLPPFLNYGKVPGENTIIVVMEEQLESDSTEACQINCSPWWRSLKSFCFLQCLRNFIRTRF